MRYHREINKTNYLVFILRAIAAVTHTVKHFKWYKPIRPELLYDYLVETFNNPQNDNSSVFFRFDEYTEEWSRFDGASGDVVLHTNLDGQTPYTVDVEISAFWRSLEWRLEHIPRLDVAILDAILRCVSDCVINVIDTIKIEQKPYLDEMAINGSLEFRDPDPTITPTWKIKISPNGVEVNVVHPCNPTENTFIPWSQIVRWLE